MNYGVRKWISAPATWALFAFLLSTLFACTLSPWLYPGKSAFLLMDIQSGATTSRFLMPLAELLVKGLHTLLPEHLFLIGANTIGILFYTLNVFLFGHALTALIKIFFAHSPSSKCLNTLLQWSLPLGTLFFMTTPEVLRAATHFQLQTLQLTFILLSATLTLRAIAKETSKGFFLASFVTALTAFESTETLLATLPLTLTALVGYYLTVGRLSGKNLFRAFLLPWTLGLLTLAFLLTALPFTFKALLLARYAQLVACSTMTSGLLVLLLALSPLVLATATLYRTSLNIRTFQLLILYLTFACFTTAILLPTKINPVRLLGRDNTETYPLLLILCMATALALVMTHTTAFRTLRHPAEGGEDNATQRHYLRRLALLFTGLLPLLVFGLSLLSLLSTAGMDAAHKTTTRDILDQKIDALKTSPAWIIDDSPLAQWTALRCHDRNITALSFISPRDLLQPVTEGSSFHTALERSELLQSALTEAQRNDLQHYAAISGYHYLKALLAKCPQLLPSIHTFTPSASLWEELSSPDLPIVALYTGVSFVGTPATNLCQHTLYALPPAATPSCATCLGFPQDIGFKNFAEYTHQEASIYHLDAASRLAQERSEPCNALALQHLTIAMDLNPSMVQSTRDGILTYLKDNILALQGAAIPSALNLKASNITPGSPLRLAPENASHHLDWLTLVPSYNLYIKTRERHPGMRTLPTYHHLRYQQLAQQEPSTAADDEALRQKYQQLLQLEQLALHHMTQTQNDEAALATINELERLLCADDVSYLRAFYWNLKGDRPKAYAYLNTFLSHYPNNIDALALLATLQLESGALQEVKHKTLPRIRAAAGTEKNYYYLIIQAQIAEKQQRLQEARTAFLQAIETRPREAHERIKETVLTLDMRLDDKHAAKQHASDFLKTDLDFPFAHYILGSLALEENDLDAARFHLKQASLEASRPIAMAYNDLAELHRRQHDYALACDYAQRAYTAQPHLVIAHETAASALIALGQYDRAEAELNTAIETSLRLAPKHPIDARIRLTRAQLFAKTGRLDQARQELRTLSPSTLDAASRKDYDALLQTLP